MTAPEVECSQLKGESELPRELMVRLATRSGEEINHNGDDPEKLTLNIFRILASGIIENESTSDNSHLSPLCCYPARQSTNENKPPHAGDITSVFPIIAGYASHHLQSIKDALADDQKGIRSRVEEAQQCFQEPLAARHLAPTYEWLYYLQEKTVPNVEQTLLKRASRVTRELLVLLATYEDRRSNLDSDELAMLIIGLFGIRGGDTTFMSKIALAWGAIHRFGNDQKAFNQAAPKIFEWPLATGEPELIFALYKYLAQNSPNYVSRAKKKKKEKPDSDAPPLPNVAKPGIAPPPGLEHPRIAMEHLSDIDEPVIEPPSNQTRADNDKSRFKTLEGMGEPGTAAPSTLGNAVRVYNAANSTPTFAATESDALRLPNVAGNCLATRG